MNDYLNVDHIIEEKDYLDDISLIRFNLKERQGKLPTIIMYHGWSSNKESQRLRAFILANLGYQVILPDAMYHGERNRLDNYDAESSVKYFWTTILNNIEEGKKLIDHCISNYNADPDRIGVIGHSMGGFTSAGVFTYNDKVKTAVILNGSFNWKHSNTLLKSMMGLENMEDIKEEEDKINSIDPNNNRNLIIDRPILLLHGGKDSLVNIESQKVFFEEIQPQYSDKSLIQLIEYSNLDHFVTTNMMEEAAIWFDKYL